MPDRSEDIPEGPTDPRLSMGDDRTTIMSSPGYGQPGSLIPPPPPPPPTAPVSVPPVTGEPFGGRVYTAGEARPPEPAAEETPPSTAADTSDRGRTTIADDVVERVIGKIVELAADEVAGVDSLIPGTDDETGEATGPVSVRLDEGEVEIDIALRVEFGNAVHEVVDKVRANVIGQTERLLGLTVAQVNVLVGDVAIEPAKE